MPTDQYAQSQPADILVVDDTIANLRLLTDILTNAGYRVRPAEQSQLALESALAQTPSLILLDVKMPEMDGFELCRQLKQDERTRDVPIIFISASQDVSDRVGGFEAGGVDFLSKPFQELEVLARVKNYLRLYYMQSHLEDMVAERTLALENEMASHKESESRFRATFEQATVGIAHVSPKGSFLRINQKFCEIVGYSQKEMLEGAFQDITHPDDLELDLDNVNKLLEGELETYSMEKRYLHKNGAIIWVNLTVSLLRTSAGKPDYFISVIEEITDKKATESQSRESEEKFRAVVDQSPIAIQIHGLDGKLITSNLAWRELNAFDDEVLAEVKEKYSILEDEQATQLGIMPSIEKVYAGESVEFPLYSYTVFDTLEKLDFANSVPMPRTRWIQTRGFPLKNEAGRVTSSVFMSVDISEQKLAEMELQESEEKFRSLMEQSPLSIQICNKDGNFVDGNKAWKQLWNISEEDMPYVKANYNILKDEEVKKRGILPLIEKAYAGEAVQVPDFFYESAGEMDAMGLAIEKAKAVWLRIKLYPVLDEAGDVKNVISIEEDISESKLAEEKLKQSEKDFRDLVEQNPLYIQTYSPEGNLINLNKSYADLLNLSTEMEQLLYKSYNIFRDPQAAEHGLEPGLKKVFDGETFHFHEYEFDVERGQKALGMNPKGPSKIWLKTTGFPIKDETGAIKHVVFLSQDVSARVNAEQGLIESEHKFRALFDTGGYAMGLAKLSDRTAIMVNKAWLALFGYSTELDVIGRSITDFIAREERDQIEEIEHLRQTSDTPSLSNTLGLRKDNTIFNLEMRVTTFDMQGEKYALSMMNDITDRLEAEKKIRESEENYRTLIEQANDGIVVIQDGILRFVNTALTKITGYSTDELLNSHFLAYIEQSEIENVKTKYAKRMKGEPVPSYESKIVRKDGKVIEIEFNGGLTNYNGAIADLAMVRDITERKKAEEERNRLYDLSVDMIGITTFDGTIKQINPAWEIILGYSIDELISTLFLNYIHPDDIQKTNNEVERLAAGNKTVNFENRYMHKDGTIRHISWTATPLVAEDSIYCIGRDITDRKKADLAIIESEEKFRLLVEQSPYSIQIFNTDGYLDQVNTSFQELWGIDDQSLPEVLENYNVLEDEEAEKLGVRKAIQKAFNGESVVLPIIEYDATNIMETIGIESEGNKKWVKARFYPVKYDQGEVVKVVSMEEDMTKVKMKEIEILNYQQRLKDLALELTFSQEKQRKEIATELHDDVGQLLASSRMQIAAIDPQMSKSSIFDELNCISTGLLNAIKATRRAIFELSPPQLNEIGLVAALADWMDEELEVKHGIKAVVLGDDKYFDISNEERFLLFRCVRELLINVIKHAQANKVALRIVEENDLLTIGVEDNGIGMDRNSETKDPKQIGFGLFSIEERIQNVGGSMDINSKLGSGTKITLFLPLKK